MGLISSLLGQVSNLPYPEEDCTDRVIIVTGANVGLGREAARHFVRLNASKVILACRNLDKAEQAKQDIEQSTQRTGVVEIWQLDLSSYDSVKEFAARASRLERLDVLLNNASILTKRWEVFEGHESQMTVNVISTLLLSLLILPTLRKTGAKYNIAPHIVIVSSDGAFTAIAPELKAENIIKAFDSDARFYGPERYGVTKLLQLMVVCKLAAAVDTSGKGHVIVNGLNPGVCKTELFRDVDFAVGFVIWVFSVLFGRTPEMGSRTLMTAAFAGEETHGNWMTNCRLHTWPYSMRGAKGEDTTNRFWDELLDVMEDIEPGVTDNI
ncbi:Short chain dehydrogenase atnD [Cladobotryum mycophilum]|uniref:Short chain dehydrogenase atnD n=1 Tax=Cladobotryum mycophilum TaxID=491253 RepID=A0ABR0SNA2_9HYPO